MGFFWEGDAWNRHVGQDRLVPTLRGMVVILVAYRLPSEYVYEPRPLYLSRRVVRIVVFRNRYRSSQMNRPVWLLCNTGDKYDSSVAGSAHNSLPDDAKLSPIPLFPTLNVQHPFPHLVLLARPSAPPVTPSSALTPCPASTTGIPNTLELDSRSRITCSGYGGYGPHRSDFMRY